MDFKAFENIKKEKFFELRFMINLKSYFVKFMNNQYVDKIEDRDLRENVQTSTNKAKQKYIQSLKQQI